MVLDFLVADEFGRFFPQGLKPAIALVNIMYGLKPVPFKLTHNGFCVFYG
jgi:hypothetical protein